MKQKSFLIIFKWLPLLVIVSDLSTFNIDMCNLFRIMKDCDLANCAGDCTPYSTTKNMKAFIYSLFVLTNFKKIEATVMS